ncbi:hypothetical protein [Sphingobacterium arenae]|nr:hypothetical protein [Sphingobacterium arenae]
MKKRNGVFAVVLAGMLSTFVSCSKDDKGTPANIEGNAIEVAQASTIAKPGTTVSVALSFANPGNGTMLVIHRDEAPLRSVPLQDGQESYTFEDTLPANLEEGDVVPYAFFIADEKNTITSDASAFEVSVALYDEITIGSAPVYQIELPEDGIIETGKVKLAAGRKYWLPHTIHFMSGTELQMEAGVELYMNTETGETYDVVIDEGAQVDVAGTATAPVVVTSDKLLRDQEAEPGDWGQFNIKGAGNGSSSGTVEYLRVEYAGDRGFRLQGVGSGTTINYVQAYRALGEGIMPTDGDVRMKYLVATNCEGGGFRFGDAYAGYVQFAISQTTSFYDEVEAFTIRETASPVISNVTIVGPGEDVDDTHGMRMRANSSGKVYNSIVADFPRRGLRLNDEVTVTDLQGPTVFAYSYIFHVPRDPYRDDTDNGNPFQGDLDAENAFQNPFFNNVTGFEDNDEDEPILATIDGIGTTSYIPQAITNSAFNPVSVDAFFSEANYVGAVSEASADWTKGWVRNYEGNIHQ